MEYQYLTQEEMNEMREQALREMELNAFRQKLLSELEPDVQAHKTKLAALEGSVEAARISLVSK